MLQKITLFFICFFLSISAIKSEVIDFTKSQVYIDSTSLFSSKDFEKGNLSNTSFDRKKLKKCSFPIYYGTSNIQVQNHDQNYVFEYESKHIDNWGLYLQIEGTKFREIVAKHKGSYQYHASFVVPAHKQARLLLRTHNTENWTYFAAKAYPEQVYYQSDTSSTILQVVFFGAILFIFVYGALFFYNRKEIYFLYFALYVLTYGAFLFNFEGLFCDLFPNVFPEFSTFLSTKLLFGAYFFNFLFVRSFLKTEETLGKLDKFLGLLTFIAAGGVAGTFVEPSNSFIISFIEIIISLFLFSIIAVNIVAVVKKVPNSKWILVSYIWVLAFGVLTEYYEISAASNLELEIFFMKIGLVGELVILSFVLTYALYQGQLKLKNELEKELRNSNEMFEELEAANDHINDISKTKDQFMVMMSHELRTPMNAIIGFSDALKHLDLTEEAEENVDRIMSSSRTLMNSIDDILDFQEYTKPNIEIRNDEFLLADVLTSFKEVYKFECERKGLRFKIEELSGTANIYWGPNRKIIKMISILLSNAVKFTKYGHITFVTEIVEEKGAVHFCKFSIKDTGYGISKEKIDLIFKPFTQLDQRYKREHQGTGIGLALFKKIAHVVGAEYDVKSNVGVGSTFSFQLPLTFVSKSAPPVEEKAEWFKTAKILLVEDNELNQIVAEKFLQRLSKEIQVTIATNGEEALEQLKHKEFELILMDLQMPYMDGYETTKQIRNNLPESVRNIPIVALTAHVSDNEREKCFDAGMNDFLTKPTSDSELRACFQKIQLRSKIS